MPKLWENSVGIFTDASFTSPQKSGWACWVKVHLHPGLIYGGRFKVLPKDSHQAEFFAIINGLIVARNADMLRKAIMFQSDSVSALQLFVEITNAQDRPIKGGVHIYSFNRKRLPDYAKKAKELVLPLLEGRQVFVRHVRGHSGYKNAGRYRVNEICDTLARTYATS